jgi:hypothetical protein
MSVQLLHNDYRELTITGFDLDIRLTARGANGHSQRHLQARRLQRRQLPEPGNSERFISNELRSIQNSIDTIIQVMKALEARMNTAGLP